MREVLRQEKKYLMSYDQFRRLDNTFEKVLHPDPHNGVSGYAVRGIIRKRGLCAYPEKMP